MIVLPIVFEILSSLLRTVLSIASRLSCCAARAARSPSARDAAAML